MIEAVTGVRADHSEVTYPSTDAWINTLSSGQLAPSQVAKGVAEMRSLCLFVGLAIALAVWPLHVAVGLAAAFLYRIAAGSPQASTPTTAAAGLPTADRVPLFSPSEVDELTLRRGLVECDCSEVTSSRDLTTDWRVVQQESEVEYKTALAEVESLTSLYELGALRTPSTASLHDVDTARQRSQSSGTIVPGASRTVNNAALHQMRLATSYLREFLSKPHPLLGRAGPTCPFVPKALKLGSMRIGVVPTSASPSAQDMETLVRGFISIFEELEPQSGPTAVFKSIVLLFPYIPLASSPQLIDGTQAALKEEFVSRGLMLGEFHLLNNASGLHNPNFFPLRTVCPTLAIRHMVPSDLVFLSGEQYPLRRRVAFLESYVTKMSRAGAKGAKSQADLVAAQEQLDQLRKELQLEIPS